MPNLTKKQKEKLLEKAVGQINFLTKAMKNFDERLVNINQAHMKHGVMLSTLIVALEKKGIINNAELTAAFNDINKGRKPGLGVQPEGTGNNAGGSDDAKNVPAATVENPASGSGEPNGQNLAG